MSVEQLSLASSGVRLEPLAERHLAQSMLWVNDPVVMAGVLRNQPVTWEDQKRWYAALQADSCRMVWAITLFDSVRYVGNTGLYNIDRIHKKAEFWIYLGEHESRGRGIASRTLGTLKTFAFSALRLQRLYLHVDVDNLPAIGLYKRHGFKWEGVLRHHYFFNDKATDVAVMAILKDEYDNAK